VAGSRSRGPVAPVRAIFHDIVPAQKRDVPNWMRKGSGSGSASSMPPTSAAALLHADQTKVAPSKNDNAQPYSPPAHQPHASDVGGAPEPGDPLLDARMQSASLADEASESWIPGAAQEDPKPVLMEALAELRAAIVDLAHSKAQMLRTLEPELLTLTRLIAERVLEGHLPSDNTLPHRLVQEGLRCLDHQGEISVTLGPGFAAHTDELEAELKRDGVVCEVTVLEHLALYACQIRTQLGSVDESVETRLDKILESISDEDDAT